MHNHSGTDPRLTIASLVMPFSVSSHDTGRVCREKQYLSRQAEMTRETEPFEDIRKGSYT